MRKFILIVLACLFGHAAYAQTTCGGAQLSWTAPTQNTDGSALTNLAGFRIVYGTSATALAQTVQVANAGVTTYCITGLSPATYYFAVKAYTPTAESANSNVVSKVISSGPMPGIPAAPGTLTIASGALEVYQVVGTDAGFQFLPVGSVPAGTQCIAAHQVNGRYRVPNAAVTWYGSVKPKVVVAQCN